MLVVAVTACLCLAASAAAEVTPERDHLELKTPAPTIGAAPDSLTVPPILIANNRPVAKSSRWPFYIGGALLIVAFFVTSYGKRDAAEGGENGDDRE